jgi:hypothetical protein
LAALDCDTWCRPDGVAQPTPHYNSSILEDMAIESTALVLKEALIGNEAMRDAVLLLKVCVSLNLTQIGIKLISIRSAKHADGALIEIDPRISLES